MSSTWLARLNACPAPQQIETSLQLIEAPRADIGRYDQLRLADENGHA